MIKISFLEILDHLEDIKLSCITFNHFITKNIIKLNEINTNKTNTTKQLLKLLKFVDITQFTYFKSSLIKRNKSNCIPN